MGIYGYKTKKDLKERGVGREFQPIETSMFGAEFKGDGTYVVVGPTPQSRKWFAEVMVKGDMIIRVK